MMKGLISKVLLLAVSIILVGGLMVPIIQDVSEADAVTKTNSGSINADIIENGDSGSIVMSDTAVVITINGTAQSYSPTNQCNVLYGENVLFNHNANASSFSLNTTVDGTTTTTSGLTSLTYTAADDKLTIVANDVTYVVGLGLTLIWGDSGDYTAAFKQNASSIYYSEDSPYLLNTGIVSIKNGVVSPSTYTLTSNAQLADGSQDIYQATYSAAAFVITDSDDATTTAGIWMMVSKEVQGLGEEKVSTAEKALYGAIPVLVLIGIVIAAAAIIYKRD